MSKAPSILPAALPQPILTFLKWQEATTGRDKVLRLVAYFTKYAVHAMKQNAISPDWQKRLASGASQIGSARKLIRFFRAVEYFNEFLKSLTIKDDVERYLSLWKAFWLAVWMVCDHIQWLQKAGYLKLVDLKKFDEYHSKGWFFGLLAGFIISAYKFKAAVEENKTARAQLSQSLNDPAKVAAANKQLKAGDEKRNKQLMGMVKSGVDIMIPASRLGWLPISDGTVGLAGTVTSIIGIHDTWPKSK